MPPWPASTTEGGPFRDARVLSAAEIATLAAWVEAGCPEGDPSDAPAAADLGLRLGARHARPGPDAVRAVHARRRGRDEFRVFVIPTGLTEGKWVAAIDFKPGNPKVVHHILAAFDTAGRARKLDEADPGPGYKVFGGFGLIPSGGLGGWAPGKRPQCLPDGRRPLPPGRVRRPASGPLPQERQARDRRDARRPLLRQGARRQAGPRRDGRSRPRPSFFGRPDLLIPAGDANYEVTGTLDDRRRRPPDRRRPRTCTGSARTSSSRRPAPTARP